MTEQDKIAATEPPLDCRVGHGTPRVEALIDRVMAMNPRHTAHGQARYYEEVHQHLAPLARDLERENNRLRDLLRQAADHTRHPDYEWEVDFEREVYSAIDTPNDQHEGPEASAACRRSLSMRQLGAED